VAKSRSSLAALEEEETQKFTACFSRMDSVEKHVCSLEEGTTAVKHPDDLVSQLYAVKRESRECLLLASNNEQYSRRNCLRIRGLSVRSQDETTQVVANFWGTKLHLTDFDISSIDTAHLVTGRQVHQRHPLLVHDLLQSRLY
jgi:hypothetical protein